MSIFHFFAISVIDWVSLYISIKTNFMMCVLILHWHGLIHRSYQTDTCLPKCIRYIVLIALSPRLRLSSYGMIWDVNVALSRWIVLCPGSLTNFYNISDSSMPVTPRPFAINSYLSAVYRLLEACTMRLLFRHFLALFPINPLTSVPDTIHIKFCATKHLAWQ